MQNFDFQPVGEVLPASSEGVRDPQRWFDRFTLATKLNVSAFASLAILLIVAFTVIATVAYYSSAGRHVADVAGLEVRTTHATMDVDDAVMALRDFRDRGDKGALAEISPALATAQENIAYTREWISEDMPPDTHATVARFEESLIELQARWDRISGNPNAAALADFETDVVALRAEIAAYARELRGTLAPAARKLFDGIEFVVLLDIVFVIVAFGVALAASRLVNRNVGGMIGRVTRSMEEIADGKVDTVIPGMDRRDELGAMARALAVFRSSSLELRDLTDARARDAEAQLERQKELGLQMRDLRFEKGKLLENLASGFEVSVGDLIASVSAASEQLKATSRTMVNLADDSNDQAGSASAAMAKTTANVTAAAAATDEFALSIGEINRQASASAELARSASDLVAAANAKMGDLSQAAQEIGDIVELIETIAQRTNLLALNASIEAARGGEAGRGFAVVASEVKELAMQTSRATSNVTEKIGAMQSSTSSSADDLTNIVKRIEELENSAVMIASAVDQQSISAEELARNIDTVAAGSAQVSAQLESLRTASEETGSAADDVVASANALGKHAEELREKAGRFVQDVRNSARELESGESETQEAAV